MPLLDHLLNHCRDFVQREVVECMGSTSPGELAYAAGVLVGERESHWLAPDAVRVASVARRNELLEEHPDAAAEVVWNVAEFDLAEWPFVAHMLSPRIYAAGQAISTELTRRFGPRAGAIHDLHFEIALREVAWDRWFAITDDFVVFTMDVLDADGTQVLASVARNAPARAVDRWTGLGWMSPP